MNSKIAIAIVLVILVLWGGMDYNDLQARDEAVKASWSEVLNQYQRRYDLVPNLVKTVQGYATHEEKVFAEVAQARSQVANAMSAAQNADPAALATMRSAQGALGASLSRLIAVSEAYPQLKADAGFRDLQAQLEGTENRIAVARGRYVKSVEEYNLTLRQFPGVVIAKLFGYQTRANYEPDDAKVIEAPPKVDFKPAQ